MSTEHKVHAMKDSSTTEKLIPSMDFSLCTLLTCADIEVRDFAVNGHPFAHLYWQPSNHCLEVEEADGISLKLLVL